MGPHESELAVPNLWHSHLALSLARGWGGGVVSDQSRRRADATVQKIPLSFHLGSTLVIEF